MAKKYKKSAVLGSQMAPSENGPVTGGFQPKNDFFGPSLVLTPLTSLETPKNDTIMILSSVCSYPPEMWKWFST